MTFPTIHLNGTNGDDLISALCDAMNAIGDAERAVRQAAPNGRDYDPEPFYAAHDEHLARLQALHAVREELGKIVENICEQQDRIAELKRVETIWLRGLSKNNS